MRKIATRAGPGGASRFLCGVFPGGESFVRFARAELLIFCVWFFRGGTCLYVLFIWLRIFFWGIFVVFPGGTIYANADGIYFWL